ncbi:MAG: hypothetical protein IKN56_09370 [Clostridia bacterium]|nr:hypothetical protein [Clostridia bacterium]
MYKLYIIENDLKQESHFPMMALFNEAANSDVVEFLNNINNEVGSGYNFTTCCFWSELDDYDKQGIPEFSGLLIETEDGEQLVISYFDLLYYLKLGCHAFVADHPEFSSKITELIEEFKVKYSNYLDSNCGDK